MFFVHLTLTLVHCVYVTYDDVKKLNNILIYLLKKKHTATQKKHTHYFVCIYNDKRRKMGRISLFSFFIYQYHNNNKYCVYFTIVGSSSDCSEVFFSMLLIFIYKINYNIILWINITFLFKEYQNCTSMNESYVRQQHQHPSYLQWWSNDDE